MEGQIKIKIEIEKPLNDEEDIMGREEKKVK